jgi:hypothetical protein
MIAWTKVELNRGGDNPEARLLLSLQLTSIRPRCRGQCVNVVADWSRRRTALRAATIVSRRASSSGRPPGVGAGGALLRGQQWAAFVIANGGLNCAAVGRSSGARCRSAA